mmetsp:Transcript_85792/g.257012  ORF Transcript_85792/g.257012 Transcript_85792/m.257012 type:complete len:216 (+) Transcript_85792:1369-2016(+)
MADECGISTCLIAPSSAPPTTSPSAARSLDRIAAARAADVFGTPPPPPPPSVTNVCTARAPMPSDLATSASLSASAAGVSSRSAIPHVCPWTEPNIVSMRPSCVMSRPVASPPSSSLTQWTSPRSAAPKAFLSSTPESSSPARTTTCASSWVAGPTGPQQEADVFEAACMLRWRASACRWRSRVEMTCLPVHSGRGLRIAGGTRWIDWTKSSPAA